jgi:type-1 restriction enzyme stySJI specificity protein
MKEDVLPEGWELKKLGSVVQYEKGKKPSNLNDEKNDIFTIPYIDIQGFEKGIIKSWTDGKNARLCQNSDLLMVWDGARAGLVGSGSTGALGSTLMKISFPKVNHTYGFYFLYSKFSDINSNTKGTGIPHVDPSVLWNFEFPIPPLPEQQYLSQKLTALLDEVAQTKQRLEAIPALLKQFRQSVLADAVSGRLTEEWREENGAILSEGKISNFVTFSPKKDKLEDDLVVSFSSMHLMSENVSEHLTFEQKHWKDVKKGFTFFKNNDVLLAKITPCFENGKSAVAQNLINGIGAGSTEFMVFRCNESILPKYLYFNLNTDSFRQNGTLNMSGSVGHKRVPKEFVLNWNIVLPSITEQTQIVQKVETYFALADEIETQVKAALENVNLLTQSILAKAFSGELSAAWRNSKVTETQGNV